MEAAAPYEGICDIPVLFWNPTYRTKLFPSVIVFTLAIGWYYLNGLFRQGGATALYALVPMGFVLGLAGAQSYVILNQPQCPPIPWWGVAGAWVIGILSGTIGYWIAAASIGGHNNIVPTVTTRQGFTTEHFSGSTDAFIFSNKGDSTSGPISMSLNAAQPSNKDHCAVPNEETYFVDLYKNGKLITQAIGEKELA